MLRPTAALAAAALALTLAPIGTADGAPTARVEDPVVVDAGGARVVVKQSPFRLTVTDGSGHPVLREVAHAEADTVPEPVTQDPIGTGSDNQDTTTLYSPLSFLVGDEVLRQYEGTEWVGNLKAGTRSGTWYSAQDVETVEHDGADTVLTLSTNDPSGRELVVRVGAQGTGAIRVRVTAVPAEGVAMLGDSFEAAAEDGSADGFFGFGGRHDRIDQRGRVLSSFVNQQNFNSTPGGSDELDMYPNGPAGAYYPQAMFWTTRYGFLLPQPELARFKMAVERDDAWNVTASAAHLDYVVAPGGPRRSARTLTELTGRHRTPPRWALGPMFDRLVKNYGETLENYESELRQDLEDIDRYRLPITAYRLEGSVFPGTPDNHGMSLHSWVRPGQQARMIRQLRKRGIHVLSYLRPWLTPESEPVKAGYAVMNAEGEPYYVVGTAERRFALLDFTNPDAVRFWKDRVRETMDLGFDGFMQDYGEQVLFDMHFADGTTGVTRHNDYLRLMAKATREELDAYERDNPDRARPWFFTRAGYTGLPGTTAYEDANFPGDETTDWDRASGLASLTTDMLSRAVGGAYGYGTDIGGYFDYSTPPTTEELFIRWSQWAALSPIFRLHGSGRTGTHAPWIYGDDTVKLYKQMSRLHLRARPLLERLWAKAERTGAPPTRPLWWQHPGDRAGWHRDQEWLLGPNLLVAPVVTKGATTRTAYLPAGCWQLHGEGPERTGRRTVTVAAPLDTLPWFSRCGTKPLGKA